MACPAFPPKVSVYPTSKKLILPAMIALLCSSAMAAPPNKGPRADPVPVLRNPNKDPRPAAVANVPASDCGCTTEGREYTAEPTPDVLALWKAASAGREDEFMQLLPKISKLADYAVDGTTLFEALLRPPFVKGEKESYSQIEPERAAELITAHRAMLVVKTRMIAAAIKHGAGVNDYYHHAPYPPLHMATALGSPEIVKMLVDAGAKVDLTDMQDRKTALEFILDQEFFVRMTYRPPLVTKAQRSEMILQLLAAGAKRPYLAQDATLAEEGFKRPAADYVIWGPLVSLTEGTPVLQAMMKTGTKPLFSDEDDDEGGDNALIIAALVGNGAAVELFKPMLPPKKKPVAGATGAPYSMELAAAIAAASRGHVKLATSLLEPGMPFNQRAPSSVSGKQYNFERIDIGDGTIMHAAVRARDAALVRHVASLGAPVDGPDEAYPRDTPLKEALEANHADMVSLLLELGANPLKGSGSNSPLMFAIEKGQFELVKTMLSKAGPAYRKAIADDASAIVLMLVQSDLNTPQRLPVIKALLERAGFSGQQVSGRVIAQLINWEADELARTLIAEGAAMNLDADAEMTRSPLTAAVAKNNIAMVDQLLKRGAKLSLEDADGRLPIQYAILGGDLKMVERLLAAGASLSVPPGPGAAPIDLAIASGKLAMVDKVAAVPGNEMARACPGTPKDALRLLQGDDAFFEALRTKGMAFKTACEGKPVDGKRASAYTDPDDKKAVTKLSPLQRMYEGLLSQYSLPVIGANAVATARRLASIDGSGGAGVTVGDTTLSPLEMAIKLKRPDLVAMLLDSGAQADQHMAWQAIQAREPEILGLLVARGVKLSAKTPAGLSLLDYIHCRETAQFRDIAGITGASGAPCPAVKAATGQEKARAKKLAGTYYLEGGSEVGAAIQLNSNGNFEYGISYGNVDQGAKGTWRIEGGKVVLSSPPGYLGNPFRVETSTSDDKAPGVNLRMRVNDRPVEGLQVYVDGDESHSYQPRAKHGYWLVPSLAPGKKIALFHPEISDRRWYIIDVPKGNGALVNRLDITIDHKFREAASEFNSTLNIVGKALVVDGVAGGERYIRR